MLYWKCIMNHEHDETNPLNHHIKVQLSQSGINFSSCFVILNHKIEIRRPWSVAYKSHTLDFLISGWSLSLSSPTTRHDNHRTKIDSQSKTISYSLRHQIFKFLCSDFFPPDSLDFPSSFQFFLSKQFSIKNKQSFVLFYFIFFSVFSIFFFIFRSLRSIVS